MLEDATKLTKEFLKNEENYITGFDATAEEVKFKEYYLNLCYAIDEIFYVSPTPKEIERFISEGCFERAGERYSSPIDDAEMRKYLFLKAQAKQFIYDMDNGRSAMFRGEDNKYLLSKDSVSALKSLGLCQRTITCK